MKKKVRDRLDRIEQALKDLIKEVGKLHPLPHRLTNGGPDHEASPVLQTPKASEKTVQKALGKTRTRTPK
ncbi:MAG: hypothetical protein K0S45_3439 [Nitrospira sp.]|jgi:hypothetical protein|nr:hypothetical protein [Nitrospira sp.]